MQRLIHAISSNFNLVEQPESLDPAFTPARKKFFEKKILIDQVYGIKEKQVSD